MTEFSMLPWQTQTGVGDGPIVGYNQAQANEFFRDFDVANLSTAGPLSGIDNELEVTGGASPISVDTGKAYAYGRYWNLSAPVLLPVVTPTAPAALTAGRVVLRTDWTTFETRALILQSADGVIVPPAPVQVSGVTWDITLATYTIDAVGKVTITDARHFNISPSAGMVRLRHFNGSVGVSTSISWSNIQQDLTHLLIVGSIEDSSGAVVVPPFPDMHVNFNGDFGAKYDYTSSVFLPAGVTTTAIFNDTKILAGPILNAGASAEARAFFELKIHDYTNTNSLGGITFKTTLNYNGGAFQPWAPAHQGYTQNFGRFGQVATPPISSITLTADIGGVPFVNMDWSTVAIDLYGMR